MIEEICRPFFQKRFVDSVVRRIGWAVSPTQVTILSALVGLLAAGFIFLSMPFLAIFFLLFSGYLDILDGSLARFQNCSSAFGAILDILSDRIVEWAVILALFLLAPKERALPCILMLGSVLICVTSFLVVGIFSSQKAEKSFDYSPGLIERAEAFSFWGAMLFLPSYFSLLAYLFSALVLLTAGIRIKQFTRYNH